MAFGAFDRSEDQPMAEINTTPLVDVMLVLLVIFMVTAPLFTHTIRVDLPQARSDPTLEKPDTVVLSVDAAGQLRWDAESIRRSELSKRFLALAAMPTQPQVQLRAHRDTRYQTLAELLAEARRSGIRHIGLVTDPTEHSNVVR